MELFPGEVCSVNNRKFPLGSVASTSIEMILSTEFFKKRKHISILWESLTRVSAIFLVHVTSFGMDSTQRPSVKHYFKNTERLFFKHEANMNIVNHHFFMCDIFSGGTQEPRFRKYSSS